MRKCKWYQGAHFTCDCPSPERAAAGPCRAHLAGRCRNGAKHCKYKHQTKEKGKTNESHLTGSSSQDTPEKKSSPIDSGTSTLFGAPNGPSKAKQVLDDFSKAQTRVCSIKECAKTFTIPLEGDKGTKWYESKGLFLPKRCEKCIEAGVTNWNPSGRPKESQLSQQEQPADGSADDPDAVDSLLTVSPHDAENANFNLQPKSSFGSVLPASDRSYAVPIQSDALFEFLGNRVAPVQANTLMADCRNESSRLQQITGHRRRTISQSDIHDCLLEQWSGLAIDADSFDQARDAIHQYMVSGHWTPTGSILMWSGGPVALNDAESASVFDSLCNQSASAGLCCDNIELCHGFVEAIHLLSESDAPFATAEIAADDVDSVSASGDSNNSESADGTITDSGSDDSTLTDLSTTDLNRMESQSDWFARVSSRHDGSPPEDHTVASARPIRNCTRPVLYTPSPSGVARDVVSSDEFHAAVEDSDLSDVSITSRASTSSTPESDVLGTTDLSDSPDVDTACLAILCHGHVVGGRHSPHFLPSVPVNNEDDMTRDFHALSMDNTTLLGTADSIALPSTDGQGETLEELNSPCPWTGDAYHSDDSVDTWTSELPVIYEDVSVQYARLRVEARLLMQAHIVFNIHTLTQCILSMHSEVAG